MSSHEYFLKEAISLARQNAARGDRPYGAVLVKDGRIVATGVNRVLETNDPTAHAELLAVREAAQRLQSPDLTGCTVYASGQPCPMCLAAMRMAGVSQVFFAHSNADAEPFGLSSAAVYADLARPFAEQSMRMTHLPVTSTEVPGLYETWFAQQRTAAPRN